ncbi:TetR/AcrR family transcriptional regulator C-terminal domain-containing protein [Nocardia fluminea]|uniref:TetR/AcrR family transcriptional regulator C-terminal domain-containing protein n=1 Tax=Nocardia fluminea TaxID=134984 RepID=UPI003D0EC44C
MNSTGPSAMPPSIDETVVPLRRRSERGELDVEDPATSARQFVSLLVQQGMHASTYGTIPLRAADAETICTEAAHLVVHGSRPDAKPS